MQIFMAFHKENVFDPKTLTFEVWGPKELSGLKSRTLAPIFTKKDLICIENHKLDPKTLQVLYWSTLVLQGSGV